jgi:hypothetical protein
LLQIDVADGRNLLESAKLALHLSLHLFAGPMEKLSLQSRSAGPSNVLAANLGDYMPQLLSQPLLA